MPASTLTSSRQPSGSATWPPPREHNTYILRMHTCPKLLLVVACEEAGQRAAHQRNQAGKELGMCQSVAAGLAAAFAL